MKRQIVRVVENIKKAEVKILRGDEWQIDRKLILKERKVYIMKDKELKVEIIQLHHDILAAGYEERQKKTELVGIISSQE